MYLCSSVYKLSQNLMVKDKICTYLWNSSPPCQQSAEHILLAYHVAFTIVILRCLQSPQKQSLGNQLIHRCLSKTKSIGSGSWWWWWIRQFLRRHNTAHAITRAPWQKNHRMSERISRSNVFLVWTWTIPGWTLILWMLGSRESGRQSDNYGVWGWDG